MKNLHKVIENRQKNKKIVLAKPNDNEVSIFENSILITEIDKEGYITYVNRRYIKLSGFSKEMLLGSHYSIDRHPDMPEGLFIARDNIVGEKKIWRGYIKSLRQDGSFYWTLTYMQAKLNSFGDVNGYILTRRMAYPTSIEEVEKVYKSLQGSKYIGHDYFMSAELYHRDSIASYA